MPAARSRKKPVAAPNARWIQLAAEFPLRPIRSDAEAARAVAMADRLTDIEKLSQEEQDYLFALADLIVAYEDEHEPESEAGPAAMLRHLLDSRGVTAKQTAEGSGLSEATISQILTGKREPSRRAIKALSGYFRVEPAVFL